MDKISDKVNSLQTKAGLILLLLWGITIAGLLALCLLYRKTPQRVFPDCFAVLVIKKQKEELPISQTVLTETLQNLIEPNKINPDIEKVKKNSIITQIIKQEGNQDLEMSVD